MAFQLPRLIRSLQITDSSGKPTLSYQSWWQAVVERIESVILSIQDAITAIQAAQAAADAANAAAAAAATAAAAAQTAADAAQATADAIELPPTGTRTVTANTSVTADDATILVDATAGAVTVTLAFAAAGDSIVVKKIDASANVVTIAAQTGETINGAPSVNMTVQYEALNCLTDSIEWYA